MSKKSVRRCLLFLFCSLCLSGCTRSRTPYLSEEQRVSLEQEIFNSLQIEPHGANSRYLDISLNNNSKYDLADFYISFPNLDGERMVKDFPAGQKAKIRLGIQNDETANPPTEQPVFFSYTIGAYTYKSSEKLCAVEVKSPIEILVKTTEGERILGIGDVLELENGTEIEGAERWNITSLSMDGSEYRKHCTISLEITGEEPSVSKAELICKLKDDTDTILWTGKYWYSTGYTFISQSDYGTLYEPGRYELVFEEIKR